MRLIDVAIPLKYLDVTLVFRAPHGLVVFSSLGGSS
jgi:hypothetical protein